MKMSNTDYLLTGIVIGFALCMLMLIITGVVIL